MKDIVFFSGAALLAGLMVTVAMAIDPRTLSTSPMSVGVGPRDVVTVEGANLTRFRETRRDTVALLRQEDQPAILKLTSRRNADFPANAKDVAYLPLSTDLEVAFATKNLKVTVTARSTPQNGSPAMRLQYSAGADGNSDWKSFLLTPEWQDYVFYFQPPPSPGNLGLDYLAVWADPDGLGRSVLVKRIVFDTRAPLGFLPNANSETVQDPIEPGSPGKFLPLGEQIYSNEVIGQSAPAGPSLPVDPLVAADPSVPARRSEDERPPF